MSNIKNPLQPLILNLIHDNVKTGYDIIKKINEITNGWKPSCGSIYPALKVLEQKQLIECELKDNKKYYKLTSKGNIILKKFEKKHGNISKHMTVAINLFYHFIKTDAIDKSDLGDIYKFDKINLLEDILGIFKQIMKFYNNESDIKKMEKFHEFIYSMKIELENF